MPRKRISSGSTFEEIAGYARVVADPPWVFVSGTTGFDYSNMTISECAAEQTEQCFRNIIDALERAGSSLEEIVRIRVYVVNREEFPEIAEIIGRHCRSIRPANTTVVCDLIDPRMKVEIEVTALAESR